MTTQRVKTSVDEARSHRDYIDAARSQHPELVIKKGGYTLIKGVNSNNCTAMPEDCRDLPKEARPIISGFLKFLGYFCLVVAIGGGIYLAYLAVV